MLKLVETLSGTFVNNKSLSNTVIAGSRIDSLRSYKEAYDRLRGFLLRHPDEAAYVTVNNAHTIVEAALHDDFRKIINNSLLSLADGRPLSVLGKLKGAGDMNRIFGPTLLETTLEWSQEHHLKHYFFGTREHTLQRLKKEINRRFPKTQIAGMMAPPFREFSDQENRSYIDHINETRPDIIWVSLGAPKQERWIFEHYKYLNHGIMIGIGAGFSYLIGDIKHAPKWMKVMALEWLYRWSQEPKRLAKRYMVGNPMFIYLVLRDLLTKKSDDHVRT
ncbi:WecB/TagA/CpsF family glycosyltransferase [candidate division KSB1 bacterium]|nr:WecB/TagA/CpsF family glycosyltransferase [candidate division KSB1 bacterium]